MSAQPNVAAHSTVLILDYGSQYTQLITRRVRELGVHSVILPGDVTLERMKGFNPAAVILSGGPSSVNDADAPTLPAGFLDYQKERTLPVLGICYGLQLLVRELGGKIGSAKVREYGRMRVVPENGSKLFPQGAPFQAWMSHGDHASELPAGLKLVAKSDSGAVAAVEDSARKLYGLQFHPEVTHTEHGRELLSHFLKDLAAIQPDWDMGSVLEVELAKIREKVGPEDHVICGLSGGVDSAVAATLVHRAVGDRLHCVFVDHGLLRFKEQERVMDLFAQKLKLPVTCVDASERFLSKLAGVEDPEKKRKIIGAEFIAVFDEAAEEIRRKTGKALKFLVQGTLYPDVIESSPGHKHAMTIKSHHNVGGLPKDMKFALIEPLRDLFKDEVRELGKKLDVPVEFLSRHPFPGPGLAVRVIGPIDRKDLDTLRHVDEIFINEIKAWGLYDQIWQAFAVFLPVKRVGVQGDGRTHHNVVALRAVTSSDGMTADWYPFESKFLAHVSGKISNEVRGVGRVVYDISSKPPATIEWE